MASTTLVTFLFECPAAARTVELLGSWDNFSKSYHLKLDRRRGPSIWSGCYTFEDIICDGDFDNVGGTRNGALKMGGTYWYYYKVDNDEEHHNPSEPSTTICPLLPGQRLNVMDVPTESRNRSCSESSNPFTLNPEDKFLTPVPPKPFPSPRLRDFCKESYTPAMHALGAPRSALYQSTSQSLSPGLERHARSASTSPQLTAGTVFADFRGLKERLAASKRSASSSRGRSRNVRDLQIGAPTLISTTAEEVNLMPLQSLQVAPTSSSRQAPQTSSSLPPSITAKMKEFSPLGSNPIDPLKDFDFGFSDTSLREGGRSSKRPRSYVQSMTTSDFKFSSGRARAQSADTRGSRHYLFSNEPWISSPKLGQSFDTETEPAPVLQQPSASLEPPSTDNRPSSSHGGDRSPGLRKLPLDKNKKLPALPRFLVPAPLFACHDAVSSPALEEDEEEQEFEIRMLSEKSSNFSTWSTDSITISSPTSDEDALYSPTFSSLTSNSSEMGSPQRISLPFTHGDQTYKDDYKSAFNLKETEDGATQAFPPTSPPQLQQLRISSFSPSLLQLDMHHLDSVPHRQAACFGLGFQGYSLPEDETTSQATITKISPHMEPSIDSERVSSLSHLEKLMSEFGYLGDAVL